MTQIIRDENFEDFFGGRILTLSGTLYGLL